MGKREVKYQSVKVKFPQKLYLIVNLLETSTGQKLLFPHQHVYAEIKKGLNEAKKIYKGLKKDKLGAGEWAMVVPLEFQEKIPLKKEYWENPSFALDNSTRTFQFLDPFLNRQNYKILVTALSAEKNILTAPMPFLNSTTLEDLDIFMATSDWTVDPKSDCSAFYSMGEPVGANIFSKEIYHRDVKRKIDASLKLN